MEKNNVSNIRKEADKAFLEKVDSPLKETESFLQTNSVIMFFGEPDFNPKDICSSLSKNSASNLIIVGYDESIGLRVMCSSIISIAAQQQPNTCKFYSFNFYNVDSEFVNVPDDLFNCILQDCVSVNNRYILETLKSIKEEIEKRISGISTNNPNIYLTFFSFQRAGVFKKDGYSMNEEGELLAYILKEGSLVGIFCLLQIDSMNSFTKKLEISLLNEFTLRVASQMNADSSEKVIGNIKASELGINRAYLFDYNLNTLTKFIPYEIPNPSWVIQLQKNNQHLPLTKIKYHGRRSRKSR